MDSGKRYSIHTIRLIYKSLEVSVGDIDEDCYSFLDLFDDAMKAFDIEAGLVLSFQDKKGYFIENDKDILSMFDRFSTELVIPISVAVLGGPTACMPPVVEVDDADEVEIIPDEDFPTTEPELASEPEIASEPDSEPNVGEPETLSTTNSEPELHPDQSNEPEQQQHEGECEAEPEPETHADQQSEPEPETQSQPKKKKGAKKRIDKGKKSSRYRLRKNEKVVDDDFVVSDEEYGHSEDEDFVVNVEEEFLESDNSESDEHLSENESDDGDDGGVSDELLSECPEVSSEDEHIADSSEEERNTKHPLKGIKGNLFNGEVDNEFEFDYGQLFRDVKHIRDVLFDYAVLGGYDIVRQKNDKVRLTVFCGGEGCQWRVHASRLQDKRTFMVKSKRQTHLCIRDPEKSIITPKWIAKHMKEDLRAEPNMSYRSIEDHLRRKYGVECERGTIYKAKRRARMDNEGTESESFAKLYGYAEVLKRLDPGTEVKFNFQDRQDLDEQPVFKRMFVAFAATVYGFLNGCRPFFGVDGTFLKGRNEGMLLTAVSVDGNKGTYPIAFCIAEGESTDSWTWFLDCLKGCIGEDNNGVPFTIMSDKQKGLINAIQQVFPSAHSRFCTKHMYANLKRENPGLDIHEVFWSCTRATNKYEFDCAMEWMQKISENAHQWLAVRPPNQWSRYAYDITSKSEHRTNNMTESFNSELREIRSLNPLKLVDEFRKQLMVRFHKRYAKGALMEGKVTKDCKEKLKKLVRQARPCKLIPGRDENYEVVEGPNTFGVNLNNNACDCNWWNISGLPCKHAVKALLYKRLNLEDYCHRYYSVENYLAAYHGVIHPLPTSELAAATTTVRILPPPVKRKPGRPRTARRRDVDEGPNQKRSRTIRCSKCRSIGHNSRSCQGGPTKTKTKKGKENTKRAEGTTARNKSKNTSEGNAKGGKRQQVQQKASSGRKKHKKSNDNVVGSSQGGGAPDGAGRT